MTALREFCEQSIAPIAVVVYALNLVGFMLDPGPVQASIVDAQSVLVLTQIAFFCGWLWWRE